MEQQMAANVANAQQDKNLYQLAGKHRKESDKNIIDEKGQKKLLEDAAIMRDFKEEEKKADLLRSERWMDFDANDYNEYVSSDEEEDIGINNNNNNKAIEEEKKDESNSDADFKSRYN